MRILLDLDDVLADFVGGAAALHGWTVGRLRAAQPRGHWEIHQPMGLTLDQFWQPIHDAGAAWWAGLALLPWATELMRVVQAATDEWFIVSAPSRCPSSHVGKLQWVDRYFGPDAASRLILTRHKYLFAQKGVLLIDDRPRTLERFAEHGGTPVLFPTWGNTCGCSNHYQDPLKVVLPQLVSYHIKGASNGIQSPKCRQCVLPTGQGNPYAGSAHSGDHQPGGRRDPGD